MSRSTSIIQSILYWLWVAAFLVAFLVWPFTVALDHLFR